MVSVKWPLGATENTTDSRWQPFRFVERREEAKVAYLKICFLYDTSHSIISSKLHEATQNDHHLHVKGAIGFLPCQLDDCGDATPSCKGPSVV